MTTRRPVPSTASVTKAAAVAALMLAATGVAGGTAWADSRPLIPCSFGEVKLPGETAVEGATHNGTVQLKTTVDPKPQVKDGKATWRVRITETNRTGAAYQHVTVVPVVFTQLGVMNPDNTTVSWVHDGKTVELPTRLGCDPAIWGASGALDRPLADGETSTVELTVTTSTSVAEKVKYYMISAAAAADGDTTPTSNIVDLPALTPTAPASPKPSGSTTPTAAPGTGAPASPAPSASTTTTAPPVTATPSASATADTPELASTGSNTGVLAATAAALVAAGGAILLTVRRRSRRHG
ncbi:LPXTG cell wall anchor domain-containing protein [Kitasatospora sp. NPDC092948]|uniref:LPXTG cell wall anchor domain-containing protein n=1 Tax=Kitasatospora sp. NPDC092948 TaxID=3364088 RepID=UPI003829C43A